MRHHLIRKKSKRKDSSYIRLRVVMAVIFLFGISLIFRLITLQVLKYDLYVALASDQHQIFNKLEPERGRIFIQNGFSKENQEKDQDLYPIATNKDFALLYAVPRDIANYEEKLKKDYEKNIENIHKEDKRPLYEKIAEKLYEVFDQEKIEKEVDEFLDSDEFFSQIKEGDLDDSAKSEFKKIKRKLEIDLRKKEIIEKYEQKLTKRNDPYEPLQKKVNDQKLKEIMDNHFAGINYVSKKHRYYPEGEIGAHFLGFVGYSGDETRGRYGLEGFFDRELSGKAGSIKAERSAKGGMIILNDREYNKPENGSDLILTINRSIQFEVCKKLKEAALKHDADDASAIVMDPSSGAILAMCSWPSYDPNFYNEVEDSNIYNNSAIFEAYEPGSIFKVFTIAAGINEGVIKPDSTYNDKGEIMIEGWHKPIKNSDYSTHGAHGVVDMMTVLEKSLNTGTIYVMQKTGPQIFADYVESFGFGEKTGIELETEGLSNINNLKRNRLRPVEVATASFGQGITATPLQIVTAYSVIANGGILMKPFLVKEIVSPDGKKNITQVKKIKRVISEKTALLVSGMMVNVVDGGHAKLAAVPGYYVAGKTGTAQVADREKAGYSESRTIHSFAGFAPVEEPRFVMLIKLTNPKDVEYSASSAAPLFGDIAEFILNYFQVEKER